MAPRRGLFRRGAVSSVNNQGCPGSLRIHAMQQYRKPVKRNTIQQMTIHKVFARAGRPLSAEQAHDLARRDRPRIGIATVYRAIRRMQDEGALRAVLIPGEGSFYEMAGPSHHHYFFCRLCNKAYVIGICPEAVRQMTPRGFVHERHDIVLHGQCAQCHAISVNEDGPAAAEALPQSSAGPSHG